MKKFLLFFVFLGIHLNAKILIITHTYNRPDFIEIQHKTFQKFLKDEYEFVVFNDARDDTTRDQINETCSKLGLGCIRISQSVHDAPYLKRASWEDYNHPCIRCANVVQYSLDILGFDHDDIVVIIDSDMFLIRPFSVVDFMNNCDMAGVRQSRSYIEYFWNGLVFFNMPTLQERRSISFNCSSINGIGLDVGGETYHYFQSHPDLKLKHIDCMYLKETHEISPRERSDPNLLFLLDQKPNNIEFLIDYSFFHYRGGGNWDHKSKEYHSQKTTILNTFIDKILQE